MTRKLIKFSWLPASWGLKGKPYNLAKANYELEGHELAAKLIEIEGGSEGYVLFENAKNDFKYDKITQNEYLRIEAEQQLDGKVKALALLKLDHIEKKVSDQEFEKQTATINEKSWVSMTKLVTDPNKPAYGSFELDWNDFFITELTAAGYKGATEEIIVDDWLNELCKNVAMEEFSGVGTFDEDVAYPRRPQPKR